MALCMVCAVRPASRDGMCDACNKSYDNEWRGATNVLPIIRWAAERARRAAREAGVVARKRKRKREGDHG